MPRGTIAARAKTGAGLRGEIMRETNRREKKGMPSAGAGYESRTVGKSRGFFETEISARS